MINHSVRLKNLIVKQFQINEDNKLVVCEGEFILDNGGIHKTELCGGRTVIDIKTTKITFSPMFEDDVMCILWTWIQDKDMHICYKYVVSEVFSWITDRRHSNYLFHKLN